VGLGIFYFLQTDLTHTCGRKVRGSVSERPLHAVHGVASEGGRGISHTSPVSTRVRVTTAGGFASKASIGIYSVCLGLRLQTCNTHWLGWAPPVNPLSGPSRCERPKHTNGPPGFLRAGLPEIRDRGCIRFGHLPRGEGPSVAMEIDSNQLNRGQATLR
jgi:hypothetical protein